MIEFRIIEGTYNKAYCFAATLDDKAEKQIADVCEQSAFQNTKICIMPDAHAGKGCTIGTTMTVIDKVVPGMVGVDIGCGMETTQLLETEIDLKQLDKCIYREIPSGTNIRKKTHPYHKQIDVGALHCAEQMNLERAERSIGTLGGGNHFIEIDRADDNTLYLVVHSGSRHIGNEVAQYYQKQARKYAEKQNLNIPPDLTYAEGELFKQYIHDMKLIQQYALWNRRAITDTILEQMQLHKVDQFSTIHNYIDTDSMILRKGAVSAKAGEKLLIPINMSDGSLICLGKGNSDWNHSAPHGAGRLMSRTQAVQALSLDTFRNAMEGIYSSCISKGTLDESPMAYKPIEEILQQITPTVDVIAHIKPIYNFKARE